MARRLAGLRGAAADETGRVTWDDLARHLRKRVPLLVKEAYGQDGGEQRPNIIANVSNDPIPLAYSTVRRQQSSVIFDKSSMPDKPPLSTPSDLKLVPSAESSQDFSDKYLGLKLKLIPAGDFLMGSPKTDSGRHPYGERQHKVVISHPFYMSKYEVTRGQFRRFVADTNYKIDLQDRPTRSTRIPPEQEVQDTTNRPGKWN